MYKKTTIIAAVVAVTVVLFNFQFVLAHEAVNAGDYQIEIGWLTEPPITGQLNAIVINVTQGQAEMPVQDVSNLSVNISYGSQNKTLTLQSLGEDTPGQFIAPILPTIPGQYTVTLGGTLGDTKVSAEVQPEVVDTPAAIQFPYIAASSQNTELGLTGWLAILGILLGLAGVGMSFMALQKQR